MHQLIRRTTSLMSSSVPFNNAEIESCDDIDDGSINELDINDNNQDQFHKIDPNITYYNDSVTSKYYIS